MAYTKKRSNGRHTGIYHDHMGRERSAGTFLSEEEALRIATAQEVHVKTGRSGIEPAQKATMTIAEYAPGWLRRHRVEPSTKSGYAVTLRKHILPALGQVRVAELDGEQVRGLLTSLYEARAGASTQKSVRDVLSAMMRVAIEDGYREGANPVHGKRVEARSRQPITVLTQEQFLSVYKELPTDGARLLADVIAGTGCRTAEAYALHVEQFLFEFASIKFDRSLQRTQKEFHPEGNSRFYLAPYTKNKKVRVVRVGQKLLTRAQDWIAANNLQPGDLMFPRTLVLPIKRERRTRIDLTAPEVQPHLTLFLGPNGREYRHGTMNGYVTGKCKCDYCKQGLANYRFAHEQAKKSKGHASDPLAPDSRPVAQHPFIDASVWRGAWAGAVAAAELPFTPTAYQLRHSHASWLIDSGVGAKEVMERLGHGELSVTELYVHRVGDGSRAADVMDAISNW